MNAQLLHYGTRIAYDRPRWCSVCGCQRETVRGKFVTHQTPNGKKCDNSGKSVREVNQEAQG